MTLREPAHDKRTILETHPFLGHLVGHERDDLVRRTRVERYSANQVIFRRGDPGTSMMAVVAGCVKISSVSLDGKEVILNIIKPGEIFGEVALLDGKNRSADATAMENVELLVLERSDFILYLKRHPEACIKLFAVLCERLRRTSEQVEDLILVHPTRLARALLRLASDHGQQTGGGALINVRLSQRELGTHVGMTREALNRQLSDWREKRLISTEDGLIMIRDVEKFERIANLVR